MARLFVPPERLAGARVVLAGDEHRHLIKVLRLAVGDEVVLFDGRGAEVLARLVAVDARSAELTLGERRSVAVGAAEITLLQGVPRGERMDLIVQKTTELGVGHIVPVLAARCVALPASSRARRWATIAQEAARQSGRADVPTVAEPQALAAALAAVAAGVRLVLHERTRGRSLRSALPATGAVALLVGPEGGFTDDEIALAEGHGFVAVGLGPRILRAETAALVAVALAQAAAGGLD